MRLQQIINAIVRPGEQSGYVAECLEIPVVTQGTSLEDVVANLKEAVSLHLDGEDPSELGLTPKPTLLISHEVSLERATA